MVWLPPRLTALASGFGLAFPTEKFFSLFFEWHLTICIIRGEAPVIDDKYDLMKHPAIKFTADGGAAAYIHSPVCLYDVGDLDFSFTSLDDVEIIE